MCAGRGRSRFFFLGTIGHLPFTTVQYHNHSPFHVALRHWAAVTVSLSLLPYLQNLHGMRLWWSCAGWGNGWQWLSPNELTLENMWKAQLDYSVAMCKWINRSSPQITQKALSHPKNGKVQVLTVVLLLHWMGPLGYWMTELSALQDSFLLVICSSADPCKAGNGVSGRKTSQVSLLCVFGPLTTGLCIV